MKEPIAHHQALEAVGMEVAVSYADMLEKENFRKHKFGRKKKKLIPNHFSPNQRQKRTLARRNGHK